MLPGLAVAEALVDARPSPASIHFVGSERGTRGDARARGRLPARPRCPAAASSGTRRARERRALVWGIAVATLRAVGIVRRRTARGGGRARRLRQRALRVAAALLRVPIVVHEQNAVPGRRTGSPPASQAAGRVLRRDAAARARSSPATRSGPRSSPSPARDRAGPASARSPARSHGRPRAAGPSVPARSTRPRSSSSPPGVTAPTSPSATSSASRDDDDAVRGRAPRRSGRDGLRLRARRLRGPHGRRCYAAADVVVCRAGRDRRPSSRRRRAARCSSRCRARRRPPDRATPRRSSRRAPRSSSPDAELDGERLGAELDALARRPGTAAARWRAAARRSAGPTPPSASPTLVEEHAAEAAPMSDGRPPRPLRRPTPIHVVGVGGAGMSAIATVLAAMGHRVTGSDLKESPVLDRLRAARRRRPVGHDAGERPHDVDAVAMSTAIPRRNPEVGRGAERGIPVLRRAEMLRGASSRPADSSRRRRHPRQDDDVVDAGARPARPGCTRRSSSAARSTRSAPAPCGTDGELARGRGRRERRHVPRARRPRPRSSPTSSPTTSTTTASFAALRDGLRPVRRRRPAAPSRVRRRPACRGARRRRSARVTYGTAERRRLPHDRRHAGRGGHRRSRCGPRPARRSACSLPGARRPQRPERRRRGGDGARARRCRSTPVGRAFGRLRRRRPAVRVPRRGATG